MESQKSEIVILTQAQLKNLVSQIISETKNNVAPESESEVYLSAKEAQQFLKIGHSTLHRFINDGRLQPVRLGRKLLFKKSDLLK
jgi:excisionase family DNA binding protein